MDPTRREPAAKRLAHLPAESRVNSAGRSRTRAASSRKILTAHPSAIDYFFTTVMVYSE
jgi:hypothetical protein